MVNETLASQNGPFGASVCMQEVEQSQKFYFLHHSTASFQTWMTDLYSSASLSMM
jgi:hypothetical protein